MASTTLHDVLQHMRCVWAAKASRDFTDSQLLERFLGDQDETAFGVLMQRHGPLVLGVCRRLTGDSHLAEDSFQGTFMVLARRAASIRKKASLASWLYGVAQHIAARAKAQATARRVRERRLHDMTDARPLDELTSHELQNTLDAEIGSLPEKYLAPLVLCYLEGKTHDAAALELRWPKTTLTNRLSRGRELLRRRLIRRGFTLSAGALASALSTQLASAAITARLTLNTVRAAMNVASGVSLAAAGLSARAIVLAQEGMKATVGIGGKIVALIVMIGVTVGGAGLAGYGGWQERADEKPTKPKAEFVLQTPPKQDVAQKKDTPAVDLFGDPLPEGAMARLGTTRFRAGNFTSALAFAQNDRILAAIGDRGRTAGGLWIWDTGTGRTLLQLPHSPFERSMALSPDGKKLFTGDSQGYWCRLRLIDVATGKVLHLFERPDKDLTPLIHLLAFSPDGKTVAAGGSSKKRSRIFFWDVESGKQVRDFWGDVEDSLWTMTYSPDGKFIATGGSEKIICIWEVATGKIVRRFDEYKRKESPKVNIFTDDQGRIDFLSFSASGQLLASLGHDSIVRLWDFDSGKVLHRLEGSLATMRTMALSKDGHLVASGGLDGSLRLWNATTGKDIRTWQAHIKDIRSLAFSDDCQTLVSSGQGDSVVRRWETSTGKEVGANFGHSGAPILMRFAGDGKSLLSFGEDGRAIEWDLKTLKELGRFFGASMGPNKDGWYTRAVDMSPDSRTAAVAGDWWTASILPPDNAIRFIDAASGKETQTWQLPENDKARFLRYSPDGNHLIAVCWSGGVRLWDVRTSKELEQFAQGTSNPSSAAWSPNGKRLAFAEFQSAAGTIAFRDIAANKELLRWNSGELLRQEFLRFTPRGESIVTASIPIPGVEGTIGVLVWGAETGVLLKSFKGLEEDSTSSAARIDSLEISPNGRVLAVAVTRHKGEMDKRSYYCKVHLFDLLSMQEIRKFDVQQGTISSLAFGVDGRMLATSGADAAILLWDLGAYANPGEMDLDGLWVNLAGDAAKADKALWNLAAASNFCAPMLRERMLSPKADAAEVAKLLASLDSNSFAERQNATLALEKLGESAEAAVRIQLEGKPSLEVRQRLQQFLSNRDKDAIRKLRAIEVLELIGTPESRQVLETLAKDAPNPRVSEAAAGALARLRKRGL